MPELQTPPLAATPAGAASGSSYDEVPYSSHPFAQSHPDRLSTVARLFGLRTPPVESCRVLELGCAAGGNLLPIAVEHPNARLVGVDLSARQVADGQKVVDSLGVKNLELKHASITDIDESWGEFDYVICHGVFSWVPTFVQDKVFDICDKQLAPNGVAYISYNTYPGWHMRGMIRDMMRYHVQRFNGPVVKTRQARALLDFLQSSVKQESSAYGVLLKQEVETLKRQADHYLYHEHLEEVNDPMYFHTFMERAMQRDLQYLGEARVGVMLTANFGPEVEKTLRMLANDLIQMEQYMDFLRNRMFRETLLCRKRIALNRTLTPEVVKDLFVGSWARPVNANLDIASTVNDSYQSPSGMSVSTTQPLLKAAMKVLQENWPATVPFHELRAKSRELIGGSSDDPNLRTQDENLLGTGLLNCYLGSDLVEMRTTPTTFVLKPGERPEVWQLARLQSQQGRVVSNRRHEVVQLNDYDFHLLPKLDGTRDRNQLVEEMIGMAQKNVITVQEHGQVIRDPNRLREAITQLTEHSLNQLGRQALLVA